MRELTGAQTRQLIDCEQAYAVLRAAERDYAARFAGALSWKTIAGRRYLYRKLSTRWVSLGPEDDDTRLMFDRFQTGREEARGRRHRLRETVERMAPVNRAMMLGRVPWTAARVLRQLDRIGVLGHGLQVVGTQALNAYERMAGVQLGADVVATLDVDLLFDARRRLRLLAIEEDHGLIGMLRRVDRSFAPIGSGAYRAANANGFLVDVITPATRDQATRNRPEISDAADELAPAEIEGLTWLENSPTVEIASIDEKGFPVTIVAPDPRTFACHKLWVAERIDRDPAKARRDLGQARTVIAMLARHLPHLTFDDRVLQALPKQVRDRAETVAAGLLTPREQIDW